MDFNKGTNECFVSDKTSAESVVLLSFFFPENAECCLRLQRCAMLCRGAPKSPADDPFLDRLLTVDKR